MGHSFMVKPEQLRDSRSYFRNIFRDIINQTDQLSRAMLHLGTSMPYDGIQRALRKEFDALHSSAASCQSAEQTLIHIAELYLKTERTLLGNVQTKSSEGGMTAANKYLDDGSLLDWIRNLFGWGESFTENHIDSIVFDNKGSYGGDQGSPMSASNKKEFYSIVRKYYPNMSDKEINAYLNKLNSEGCGYVAAINTIFAAYEGKEAEFRKTFGFDMYGKNGDLNYNRLLVDFYAATDNHNMVDGKDTIDPDEDASAEQGFGLTPNAIDYRMHLYLDEKGVDFTIRNHQNITPDNFDQYSKDGYVLLAYYYGNLQNEDGSCAQYINGGHGMIVTGTTSDGRFIVSSWGGKYYIDPNETITKTDSDGLERSTIMGFQHIKYNQ